MYPTISPTIPQVTPAPKIPSGAVTPITQQQASYTTGQSTPTVGTKEYNIAQQTLPIQTPASTQLPKEPSQSQILNTQLQDINNQHLIRIH